MISVLNITQHCAGRGNFVFREEFSKFKDLTVDHLAKFSVCTDTFRYARARIQTSTGHLDNIMCVMCYSLAVITVVRPASSVKWSVAMTAAIGRCCRLVLMCVVLLVISVMSANFKGEIQSCSGWRLNHLPEVRRFLKEVRVLLFEKKMSRYCDAMTQTSCNNLTAFSQISNFKFTWDDSPWWISLSSHQSFLVS